MNSYGFTTALTAAEIATDKLLRHVIPHVLDEIGWQCGKLSEEFKLKYSAISWKEISDTIDRALHEYLETNYRILANSVLGCIPNLEMYATGILISLGEPIEYQDSKDAPEIFPK